MPTFTEMDPSILEKLTEGYENELAPEAEKLDAFYAQKKCPRCHAACDRHFISAEHAFGGSLVPRSGLKCKLCDCVFDPHSGIILTLGNPGRLAERVNSALPPLIGQEDD